MELIICFGIAWLLIRGGRLMKEEWQHEVDNHTITLGREHQDWSKGRIRRNARRRARGYWLAELRDGFPTVRRMLAEDRELGRTMRLEAEADGAVRLSDLRKRARAAADKRDAACDAGTRNPETAADVVPAGTGPVPAPVPVPVPDVVPAPLSPPVPESVPVPEPVPGTGDETRPVPGSREIAEADSVTADDDDSVPNPPSDETTDDTTEKEGDGVTDIEDAESPYQGMQNAFRNYAAKAEAIRKEAGDDLTAQAAIHGFERDGTTMAAIQALADQADALAAAANSALAGLIGRHNAGEEYHGTGQDADATAFRAA